MSERPPAVSAAEDPEPRESALVVLFRRNSDELELLLGRRSRASRFLPGYWAFIGGGLERQDEPGRPGAHARCAVRELNEEAAIALDPDLLLSAGVRVTPPFHPLRFRTEFFVAEVPESIALPESAPRPEEIEELGFFGVARLLDEWERAARRVSPPLPPLLRTMQGLPAGASRSRIASALESCNALEEATPRIEFAPGYWLVPQRSKTLPPATHTNTWLVGGSDFLVVDPGSDDPDQIATLERTVRRRARETGAAPRAILLTHHHQDHVAGAPALAEAFDLPILSHPATAPRLPFAHHPALEASLADLNILDLAGARLRVLHTPGHAPGHVALFDEDARILLAADLVSGLSTIVVLPGEGDMGAYMRSLEATSRLGARMVLPSHGPPLPARAITKTLAHRQERERRVFAALGARSRRLGEVAAAAYEGEAVPRALAEIQARAHLEWLVRQGRVERDASGWRLR